MISSFFVCFVTGTYTTRAETTILTNQLNALGSKSDKTKSKITALEQEKKKKKSSTRRN